MPKTSYGFHILGVIRAVTAMRYIMPAIIAQPPTIRRPRFSLLSSRFCFFRCPGMSTCQPQVRRHGKQYVPLLGLKKEIVVGIVTSVVIVRMKKGKN
jgi:hypothetical protein